MNVVYIESIFLYKTFLRLKRNFESASHEPLNALGNAHFKLFSSSFEPDLSKER